MKAGKQLVLGFFLALFVAGCAAGPLTTREKGGLLGGALGAGVGALIGSTSGHPGAGAAIGGALGLGAGALIGDQMQSQDQKQADLENQIRAQELELERLRREQERLRRQQNR